ncbi:Glutamate--tRNA ligase mitochondrial [Coemansia sp. RSA 1200]|nr:Glutamate--tRNA ligase mitochondrial [Coemansia sp. RSA 1200]
MLHLGGLRTALFNYLLARRYGGSFILRIEDTDQKRLVPGATENIIRTLEWAGLLFDEGPGKCSVDSTTTTTFFQSQRSKVYLTYAHELLNKGAAYRCFCDARRLETIRANSSSQGRAPMYDRHCLNLSQRQIDEKLRTGESFTIRMLSANPADPASADVAGFNDIVYGNMRFQGPAGFDDAVLLKSDGLPTYHLANVVDDHLMGITHVLRGEEWLMSTPKHRTLFKAFGWTIPQYAHLPLLMNSDGSKLSKRNKDGPIQGYIDLGYLPSAVINYVALLGWHPGDSHELFTLRELEGVFSLGGLSRSKSIVSRERLDWLNRQHLRREISSPSTLPGIVAQVHERLRQNPALDSNGLSKTTVERALHLCNDRLLFASDVYNVAPFLFADPDLRTLSAAQILQKVPAEKRLLILNNIRDTIARRSQNITQVSDKSKSIDSNWIGFAKEVAASVDVPTKYVMIMLRLALTGRSSGPTVPELLSFLSADTALRRLDHALELIESNEIQMATLSLPSSE